MTEYEKNEKRKKREERIEREELHRHEKREKRKEREEREELKRREILKRRDDNSYQIWLVHGESSLPSMSLDTRGLTEEHLDDILGNMYEWEGGNYFPFRSMRNLDTYKGKLRRLYDIYLWDVTGQETTETDKNATCYCRLHEEHEYTKISIKRKRRRITWLLNQGAHPNGYKTSSRAGVRLPIHNVLSGPCKDIPCVKILLTAGAGLQEYELNDEEKETLKQARQELDD